jgi:hypothetical protein
MLAMRSIGRLSGLHAEYEPPSPPYEFFAVFGARSILMVSITKTYEKCCRGLRETGDVLDVRVKRIESRYRQESRRMIIYTFS